MKNITLFSHILNEELLLPGWLNHHKKLFTHGVILNCMSTDRSAEIIRQICPTWEVIDVKYAPGIDILGIQYFEEKYDGWKMALNVSEYLIIDDLQKYVLDLEEAGKVGVCSTGIIIVDRPDDFELNQFKEIDLMKYKDYGYIEQGKAWSGNTENLRQTINLCCRNRLLHRNHNGRYEAGRHRTELDVEVDDKIFVAWLGRGSPELYLHRCNEWSNPPNGVNIWNDPRCFDWYKLKYSQFWSSENDKSVNLFEAIPLYKKYIDSLYSFHSSCSS